MRGVIVETWVPGIIVFLLMSLPWAASAAEWPTVNRLAVAPGIDPATRPALVELEGELANLSLAESGQHVTFRRGEQVQTLDDAAPEPGGRYFQLHHKGSQLYALWWRSQRNGAKSLYLRGSADSGKTFGPLAVLNTGGAVLPEYQVAADGAGGVVVIFHDERAGYGVYVNRSTDGGKTWLASDIRLDSAPASAAEPQPAPPPPASATEPATPPAQPKSPSWSAVAPKLIYQNGQWLAVWQQLEREGGNVVARWLARTSTDGGQNWTPAVEIQALPRLGMTEMVLLNHRDQVYLVGFARNQGLLAFRSADMGRSWAPLGVLALSGSNELMGSLSAVASGDNVVVSYIGERDPDKSQVYVAILSAAAGAWQSPPRRLDRKDSALTKTIFADLATLPNGAVIAVWEDYRYILPAIYLDYSADGGNTWLPAPLPLTEPGRQSVSYPRLLVGASQVVVIVDQWLDPTRRQRDTAYLALPYQQDRGLTLPEIPAVRVMAKEESLQRISQRAKEFWTLRTQGKFAESWDYFDPVYRAQYGKSLFALSQGRITYIAFELGEPTVDGIFGTIPVTITYILPSQKLFGDQPLQEPSPRKSDLKQEWIWFYDDWYTVSPPAMGPSHLDY